MYELGFAVLSLWAFGYYTYRILRGEHVFDRE
jgi:hypothetical protein